MDLAAVVAELDLGSFGTRDELVWRLQERRAHQTAALAAQLPDAVPTATAVHLRATQRREIQVCEEALTQLGAPFVAPNLDEETP
jgi:hypothetical protein